MLNSRIYDPIYSRQVRPFILSYENPGIIPIAMYSKYDVV